MKAIYITPQLNVEVTSLDGGILECSNMKIQDTEVESGYAKEQSDGWDLVWDDSGDELEE